MYQPNILIVDGGLVHIIIILIINTRTCVTNNNNSNNNIEDVVRAAAAALYKVRSLGSIEPLTKAPNLKDRSPIVNRSDHKILKGSILYSYKIITTPT